MPNIRITFTNTFSMKYPPKLDKKVERFLSLAFLFLLICFPHLSMAILPRDGGQDEFFEEAL